jgi:hypothetical protein
MKPFTAIHAQAAATLASAVVFSLVCNPAQAHEPARRPLPANLDAAASKHASAEPAPLAPRAPASGFASGIDHSRMYYDAPGDGSVWARGESYKASFDASGATYFPAFGKQAPHDFAHALSPDAVMVGGNPLSFDRGASAVRNGNRVDIDRGAFTEAYELSPQSVEQLFVFRSLPQSGDLVVHIPVASELAASETPDGLEFRGELGRVTYGRATAIDAAGRRAAADTHLENGSVSIRVDASFLAGATLPLVIDPMVGTVISVDSTLNDTFDPDVAWDPGQLVWLVVYEQTFSATDTDVYVKSYSNSGTLLESGYVDFTTTAWSRPRCADLAAAAQFLVVSEITSTSPHMVMGRTVQPDGAIFLFGPQFVIASSPSNAMVLPDVGGDPYPLLPSYYCVVYEEDGGGYDDRIAVRLVTSSSTLVGSGPTYMAHQSLSPDHAPSISKSDDTTEWLFAWQRVDLMTHGDIWAGYIDWAGNLIDDAFQVSGGLAFDGAPAASSPLHNTSRFAIAYPSKSNLSASFDIMVAALDGTTVLQIADLQTLENSGQQPNDQIQPSIDSDGRHFLVQYGEFSPSFANYNVFASDLFLSGSQLGVSESHIDMFVTSSTIQNSRVCAAHDATSTSHRFFSVMEFVQNSTDRDVIGQMFDVVDGGSTGTFCFGDGTGAACPCGNSGDPGHGCANSAHSIGALLSLSGTASTLNDSLSLQVHGVPNSATCTFLQGTAAVNPVLFGDGLRCAGGTLIRLAVKAASSGTAVYPVPGEPSVSVKGAVPPAGGMRTYQVWYRDNNATFCTSSTFNISNGGIANWAP